MNEYNNITLVQFWWDIFAFEFQMQDVPGPFVPDDYNHLDEVDPDSRNVALDEERRYGFISQVLMSWAQISSDMPLNFGQIAQNMIEIKIRLTWMMNQ